MKTITEIHDAFDRKKTSPTELAREAVRLARAEKLNAFLHLSEERALAQAAAAEKILAAEGRVPRSRMPLLGIPLGIKDNLVIDGVRTTCASQILENYVPPYTATCVARLESAGAVTLGKLNLDEFAMGGSNENSAFGPVDHPTHSGRVPGGSSGGSAAAVRAGLCVGALGSDTGGSVRLPAAYCGVVGFKPTYGRISRYGLVAFASSLDQVGPLARTVEDVAILTDAMSGADPLDSTCAPSEATRCVSAVRAGVDWSTVRLGVPKEYFEGGLSADVSRALEDAMKWMVARGAKLTPVSVPHARHSIAVYYVDAVSEASANLERFDGVRFGVRPPAASQAADLDGFYKAVRAQFGPEVKRRILLGTHTLSSGFYDAYFLRAAKVRRLIARDFDQALDKVDAIIAPVAATTAFRRGEKNSPLQMYLNDLYTIPANLAGLPAVSVPCGQDADGLSVGMQLIGPRGGDEPLLALAGAFEKGRA